MADGVVINPGSGGPTVDTETNALRNGAQMQRMKIVVGDVDVDGGDAAWDNPLPVIDEVMQAATTADAPVFTAIAGDPTGDYAGLPLLELLMNPSSGESLAVRTTNPVKTDVNNATIISDAPLNIGYYAGLVGPGPLIDTTGYNSIVVTWSGANGTFLFQTANDPEQFTAALSNAAGWPVAGGSVPVTTIAASAGLTYVFPVTGRYFRLYTSVAGTAGPVTTYLRTAQCPPLNNTATYAQNISQIGGTAPVTAGVAGMFAVGGNIGPGVAPTANPVLTGGIDYNGLTRRVQTDASGNMTPAGTMPAGYRIGQFNATYTPYTAAIGSLQFPTLTAVQSSPAPVIMGGVDIQGAVRTLLTTLVGATVVNQEAATGAGNSVVELLAQMVALLKVNNYYQAANVSLADDPDVLLNEFLSQTPIN